MNIEDEGILPEKKRICLIAYPLFDWGILREQAQGLFAAGFDADFKHFFLTGQNVVAYVFEPLGGNFFHLVVNQIQAELAGKFDCQVHEFVESFFAGRNMRNIQKHTETAVGLVIQQRIGKRFVVQSMDGEQLRIVVVAEVERAVFTEFEACIFHGGTQFYAADIGMGNQVNGDGLVNTRTELVEGLRNFGERVQVGMQNFAVHQLGKSINLLVEVLQLFTRGQTIAA